MEMKPMGNQPLRQSSVGLGGIAGRKSKKASLIGADGSQPRNPLELKLSCHITSLHAIDMQSQTFSCAYTVYAKLENPRNFRSSLQDSGNLCDLPWSEWNPTDGKLWSPRMVFNNLVTEITEKRGSAWVEVKADGIEKLVFKWRGRGVFSETFNLQKFPFDVQRLSIRLISRRPSSELLLIPDDDGGTSVDSTNFMEDNEWSILTDLFDSSRGSLKTNLCVFPTETNPEYEKDGEPRSKVKISFYLSRGCGFHILNTFLPMFLLTMMAVASYFIDAVESVGDRLAITTTIVLAIVLFQNGVDCPKVSYLTFQVKYKIFCCEIPLFLMVLQNCVASKFTSDGSDDVDWYTLIAWVVMFGVLNLSFMIWAMILAFTRGSPESIDELALRKK